MHTQTKESQSNMTPESVLALLQEGNKRFVGGNMAARNLGEQVKQTATGQFPLAVILSCVDSRVSAELVFDQGVGDIFSARVAGNVLNGDILGSMEFACKLAGSKLVVVMGHSSCGAVKGAVDGAEMGNLTGLLNKLQPAISTVKAEGDLDRNAFVQRVADENVSNVLAEIREKSAVLNDMIVSGDIGIVGAMYFVESGEVTFSGMVKGV